MSDMYGKPDVSVVLPVYNEAACIEEVMDELVSVLEQRLQQSFEVIAVDDGSTDGTAACLARLKARHSCLRIVTHTVNVGQSYAFASGFQRACGSKIVTLDADGQNDPADIPMMVRLVGASCDCCCGYRAERRDGASRRLAGRFSNWARNAVLGESIIDTGCSAKVFRSELVKDILPWDGMHRFFGSYVEMRGGRVMQVPVHHRARRAGVSKYSNWGRLKRTVADLFGVKWLKTRMRLTSYQEAT